MMKEMKFKFEGEIKTSSRGDKIKVNYEQNSFFKNGNDKFSTPLFHKVGKKYFYEYLGRNGENLTTKAGTNISIRLNMFDFLRPIDVQLQHDKLGRLNLGELKGVKSLNINGVQYNLEEYAKYCYPERVDIIPGESFTLPLYTNNKISLKDNYFVLYQYFNRSEEPSVLIDIKK